MKKYFITINKHLTQRDKNIIKKTMEELNITDYIVSGTNLSFGGKNDTEGSVEVVFLDFDKDYEKIIQSELYKMEEEQRRINAYKVKDVLQFNGWMNGLNEVVGKYNENVDYFNPLIIDDTNYTLEFNRMFREILKKGFYTYEELKDMADMVVKRRDFILDILRNNPKYADEHVWIKYRYILNEYKGINEVLLPNKLGAIHKMNFKSWQTSFEEILNSENNITHVEVVEELELDKEYSLRDFAHTQILKCKNDDYDCLYFYIFGTEDDTAIYSFKRLLTLEECIALADISLMGEEVYLTITKEVLKNM